MITKALRWFEEDKPCNMLSPEFDLVIHHINILLHWILIFLLGFCINMMYDYNFVSYLFLFVFFVKQIRKSMAKFALYRKFTNSLAVSVLLSVAWIGYEVIKFFLFFAILSFLFFCCISSSCSIT